MSTNQAQAHIQKTVTLDKSDLPSFSKYLVGLSLENKINVIALIGDLGAGKTTLTQQIAKTLGINDNIQSPTFVLMNEYVVPQKQITQFKTFTHIDAYRIDNIAEADILDLSNLAKDKTNLIIIEWADKVQSLLPEHYLEVKIQEKGDSREFEIKQK